MGTLQVHIIAEDKQPIALTTRHVNLIKNQLNWLHKCSYRQKHVRVTPFVLVFKSKQNKSI